MSFLCELILLRRKENGIEDYWEQIAARDMGEQSGSSDQRVLNFSCESNLLREENVKRMIGSRSLLGY